MKNSMSLVFKLMLLCSSIFVSAMLAANPVPYPDIGGGNSSTGTKKVKAGNVKGGSTSSTGDEAGTSKGVGSSTNMGKTSHPTYSSDVKVEGKNVPLGLSPTSHNN